MPTIHVREKFHFTTQDGITTEYKIGSHTVSAEVAGHAFVKARCNEFPVEAGADAGALTAAHVERDALAKELASLKEMLTKRDAEAMARDSVLAATLVERDALAGQVAELGNQIAELQAGGSDAGDGAAPAPKAKK